MLRCTPINQPYAYHAAILGGRPKSPETIEGNRYDKLTCSIATNRATDRSPAGLILDNDPRYQLVMTAIIAVDHQAC